MNELGKQHFEFELQPHYQVQVDDLVLFTGDKDTAEKLGRGLIKHKSFGKGHKIVVVKHKGYKY